MKFPLPVRANAFVLISGISLMVTHADAALVNVSVSTLAAPASKFVSTTGENLSTGSSTRVGFFTFGDSPSLAEQAILTASVSPASYAAINALFTAVGTENAAAGSGTGAITVNDAFGTPGAALGTINNVDNGGFTPANARMWVWVFNNANPTAASQWGIFTAATGWNLPALGTETLATAEVTIGYVPGAVNQGASLRDPSGNLRLAIPEPSALALVVGSGFFFFVRRRRK